MFLIAFHQASKDELDGIKSKALPLQDGLKAADSTSEVIDYSPAVNRVARLLNKTETVSDNVDGKIEWLTNVMSKTAELHNAVTEMEEWLPGVEKTLKDLGPVSSDRDVIKDQKKEVQVRTLRFASLQPQVCIFQDIYIALNSNFTQWCPC